MKSKYTKILVGGEWITKCGYADFYKGILKPTCGCQVCSNKYELNQMYKRLGLKNISF